MICKDTRKFYVLILLQFHFSIHFVFSVPLDVRNDDEFKEREAQAERVAREIEKDAFRQQRYQKENDDDLDEESRYSAVIRDEVQSPVDVGAEDSSATPIPVPQPPSSSQRSRPSSQHRDRRHREDDRRDMRNVGPNRDDGFRVQNSRNNRVRPNGNDRNGGDRILERARIDIRDRNHHHNSINEPNWREPSNRHPIVSSTSSNLSNGSQGGQTRYNQYERHQTSAKQGYGGNRNYVHGSTSSQHHQPQPYSLPGNVPPPAPPSTHQPPTPPSKTSYSAVSARSATASSPISSDSPTSTSSGNPPPARPPSVHEQQHSEGKIQTYSARAQQPKPPVPGQVDEVSAYSSKRSHGGQNQRERRNNCLPLPTPRIPPMTQHLPPRDDHHKSSAAQASSKIVKESSGRPRTFSPNRFGSMQSSSKEDSNVPRTQQLSPVAVSLPPPVITTVVEDNSNSTSKKVDSDVESPPKASTPKEEVVESLSASDSVVSSDQQPPQQPLSPAPSSQDDKPVNVILKSSLNPKAKVFKPREQGSTAQQQQQPQFHFVSNPPAVYHSPQSSFSNQTVAPPNPQAVAVSGNGSQLINPQFVHVHPGVPQQVHPSLTPIAQQQNGRAGFSHHQIAYPILANPQMIPPNAGVPHQITLPNYILPHISYSQGQQLPHQQLVPSQQNQVAALMQASQSGSNGGGQQGTRNNYRGKNHSGFGGNASNSNYARNSAQHMDFAHQSQQVAHVSGTPIMASGPVPQGVPPSHIYAHHQHQPLPPNHHGQPGMGPGAAPPQPPQNVHYLQYNSPYGQRPTIVNVPPFNNHLPHGMSPGHPYDPSQPQPSPQQPIMYFTSPVEAAHSGMLAHPTLNPTGQVSVLSGPGVALGPPSGPQSGPPTMKQEYLGSTPALIRY